MIIKNILNLVMQNIKNPNKNNFFSKFRPGETVKVRNESEILTTLDKNYKLEGLLFIPEMRKYCGKTFKVLKCASKISTETAGFGMRYIKNTVILEGVACDGEAHGRCQRTCLLFWKDAWLKKG